MCGDSFGVLDAPAALLPSSCWPCSACRPECRRPGSPVLSRSNPGGKQTSDSGFGKRRRRTAISRLVDCWTKRSGAISDSRRVQIMRVGEGGGGRGTRGAGVLQGRLAGALSWLPGSTEWRVGGEFEGNFRPCENPLEVGTPPPPPPLLLLLPAHRIHSELSASDPRRPRPGPSRVNRRPTHKISSACTEFVKHARRRGAAGRQRAARLMCGCRRTGLFK